MKKKNIIVCLATLMVLGTLCACESGQEAADEVSETVLDMASNEDKAEAAVDAFHEDGDAKEAEFDSILEGVQ